MFLTRCVRILRSITEFNYRNSPKYSYRPEQTVWTRSDTAAAEQDLHRLPLNRGMKATAAKGIYFGHFVNKWRVFDRGCKKIFQTTFNHYNIQKLFMFPIILLFNPNIEDRQDLNIELRKLNENNRNGKQEH